MKLQSNKLKVRVGRTLEGTIFEIAFLVLAILVWAFIVWLMSRAPDTVPTHFNLEGKADSWGSPTTILFPCIITTVVGAGLLLAAYFPHTINIPVEVKTPRQVVLVIRMARVMALEILLLTLALAFISLGSSIGHEPGIIAPVFIVVGVLSLTCIVFTVLVYRAGTQPKS